MVKSVSCTLCHSDVGRYLCLSGSDPPERRASSCSSHSRNVAISYSLVRRRFGLALTAIMYSLPLFSIIFAAWRRITGRRLRESLGIAQFVVFVLGFFIGPITVMSRVVSDLHKREAGSPASIDPMLHYDLFLRSVEAIIIAWIISCFIFAYNVYLTSHDKH